MKGELGNGHDARVDRIEIRETGVEIWFKHVDLYVPEAPGKYGVWSCTGHLVLHAPEAVSASWHRMSLWVLEGQLTVAGTPQPWEVLVDMKEQVSMTFEWSNGAKLSISNARTAVLSIEPVRRTGETLDEEEPEGSSD